MQNICRACMSQEEKMISIFDQSKSPSISHMIMEISTLEFLPSDAMPSQMCISCFETLEITYYFKIQLIKSNITLQEHAETSKLLELQQVKKEEEHNEYVNVVEDEISTEDVAEEDAAEDVDKPSLDDIKDVNSNFEETCVKPEGVDVEEHGVIIKANCELVPQIRSKNDDRIYSEDMPLTWLHENSETYQKSQDVQHRLNENGEETRIASEGAYHLNIPMESAMNLHIPWHTDETTSKQSRNALPKPHKCKVCGKAFEWPSKLKAHMRTHTGEAAAKPHKCDVCIKSFEKPSYLKMHMRSHTGERPFKCPYCNWRTTTNSSLNQHIRSHTGDTPKPYKCEFCGKYFSAPSKLRMHMRIHTGEVVPKPYKCDVCGKSYEKPSYLKNHKISHTSKGITQSISQK